MTLIQLFKSLKPYVYPYRWLVVFTLLLTFIGAFMAQVNAWVLRYTVDSVAELLDQHKGLEEGISILITISIILLSKEIVNTQIVTIFSFCSLSGLNLVACLLAKLFHHQVIGKLV